MLYQSLSLVATQFTHANIKLPKKVDYIISYFLVSPDMHKIHHHHVLPYTDSNYGNIFSIWDRMFGTYMKMNREDLVYGIDVFPDEAENSNIKDLLKQPFSFSHCFLIVYCRYYQKRLFSLLKTYVFPIFHTVRRFFFFKTIDSI